MSGVPGNQDERASICLEPRWDDGVYRVRCSQGTAGVCARHGEHKPHPDDGRPCDPMNDGYCRTHGVYVDPRPAAPTSTGGEADDIFRDPTQKGRQLGVVIGSLLDTYKPEGVGIWLNSPNRNLDGRRPLDLIAAGEGERVLSEADRMAGGPTRCTVL